MIKRVLELLSGEEVETIHAKSLEVLEIDNQNALKSVAIARVDSFMTEILKRQTRITAG